MKNVYFFIILIVYVTILLSDGIYQNDIVYITNAVIVVYSLYRALSNESFSYSARKTFYLFIFFFMGIAPILQYKNGDQTVGGYDIYESTYITTNILMILVLMIFDVFYFLFSKYNSFALFYNFFFKGWSQPLKMRDNRSLSLSLLAISIFSCLCTIAFYRENIILMIFRGLDGMDIDMTGDNNLLFSLMNSFIRPLSVVCCINYCCIGSKKWLKILLVFLMIITCFLTSLSRLRTAAYYLPLLVVIFPSLRWKNRYVLLLSMGVLLVFPFLNLFRKWGEDNLALKLDFDMFRSINFDSYQSLAFVLQNDIVTYGKQLLLVFFFWVPRTLWEDKPYMSGMMVADNYGLWFRQISMNYFAEGYINAGFVGVFVFTMILAYLTAMFDKLYWKYNAGNIRSLFTPFFLFFIGMYFFFFFFDLMYGTQYTVMLLLANYFCFRIIKKYLI